MQNKGARLALFTFPALLLILLVMPQAGNVVSMAPARQATLSAPPQNVVVIMVDDLDFGLTRRLYVNGLLPNIATYLGQQGTVFLNSFVTTAVCCPSRATYLTGQYSHNHGVVGNNTATGISQFDDSSTLATWLQDAGYYTGHIGKYLTNYGSDPAAPVDSPLHPLYVPPGYDVWRGLTVAHLVYDYEINADGVLVSYGSSEAEYQTDVLAMLASAFISETETADSQPFFLTVMPLAPHVEQGASAPRLSGCDHNPWKQTIRPAPRHAGMLASAALPQPPSFNELDISDKPPVFATYPIMTAGDIQCAEAQYQAMGESMLAVDDLVGTVVDALAMHGELDSTLLIFTSDNGFYHGEHRMSQKVIGFEEGIRVPLAMRAPGYAPGQRAAQLVVNNDLAPTIAAWAGVTPGLAVDGRSLLPLLQDPTSTGWRQRFLVEYQGELIQYVFPRFFAVRTAPTDTATPSRTYIVHNDGPVELYDLVADPYQLQSAHDDPAYAAERAILAQHVQTLQTCSGLSCQQQEDN